MIYTYMRISAGTHSLSEFFLNLKSCLRKKFTRLLVRSVQRTTYYTRGNSEISETQHEQGHPQKIPKLPVSTIIIFSITF
jgi:hypothetical protein